LTGSNGLQNVWRETTGELCNESRPSIKEKNIWLKIEKKGNVFQSYYKKVGTTSWSKAGEKKTIQFSNDFYVGIAVTSHDNGKIATLTFANFKVNTCPPDIAKTAMNRCDESMALLVGSQTSLGTLKAIADLVKAEGPERMPGSCCFDTPTSNDTYLGVDVRQLFIFCLHIEILTLDSINACFIFQVQFQNHDMQEQGSISFGHIRRGM
jgi:hypothetical protein